MLERLPIEIGYKIFLEHSDGPWELEDNVNTASLVCKEWHNQLQPLRVPHLKRRTASLSLDLPSKLAQHPAVPADDFHEFLALHPNARHAVLVNLMEDALIENEMFGGDRVPYVYLQNGHWRGLHYLTLCAVNVGIYAHDLAPTDVYALQHLRIELVGTATLVDGLEAVGGAK
ncbi:hypothetical protein B0A53_00814 [Rhodotorula sp. CCFEE 5036]|nr:hypothetical protein B0A53_00814 [Rhodotorula sp. CCFEE 5036]